MVTGFGLRPFTRTHDGIMIHLTNLAEWPADMPLPDATTLVATESEMFRPYWRLVLDPHQTTEVVVGWFTSPRPPEEIANWYRATLSADGWLPAITTGHQLPESTSLNFTQPNTDLKIEIQIVRPKQASLSTLTIRRVLKHPHRSATIPDSGGGFLTV